MKVSRSGFYDYLKRNESTSEEERLSELDKCAIETFSSSKGTYGTRRMSKALKRAGHSVGRYGARTLMRKLNLVVKSKKRFRVTTNSKHKRFISPNLVQRNFASEASNHLWLGDITYIWTRKGWLYLAVVLDAYSRKIVGWSMDSRITNELVTSALQSAVATRQPAEGCIFHSDRGSQYASKRYRSQLNRFGFQQSMSRKGDCWDNAPMERFFSSLKRERTSYCTFEDRKQARSEILNYILFYNNDRLHSYLDYIPPVEMERAA